MFAAINDYHWLVSPEASPILSDAALAVARDGLVLAATRLRKSLAPARSQLVLAQCELRERAREKFPHAEGMFFTDVGLQQASGEVVAKYKASRFPATSMVLDLCCGIGGDLLALAERGPAIGFERDEIAALFASANCQALGRSNAVVRVADVNSLSFDRSSLVHIDPDRRARGQRTTRLELHEPGEECLATLMNRCGGGAIKLAPACAVPAAWRANCELQWISHRGECKQLVAWFGTLAQRPGGRVATTLTDGATAHSLDVSGNAASAPGVASAVGRYLYDPDPAVIAARLVDAVAAQHPLSLVAPSIAYLTGDELVDDPLLTPFEVIDVLPLDAKRVKAALRAQGVGRLEVKKRGVAVEPEKLRRKLKVEGENQATLILTPHAGKTIAMLARRINVDKR